MNDPMQTLLRRRTWIRSASALAVSVAAPALARTDYPHMPVKLIVPAAPGGAADLLVRIVADPLARLLGQPVVVDNRAGGSGAIAAQSVARGPADGYNLLFQYSAFHVITPQITSGVRWDPLKDFVPVAMVVATPQVVVVRPELPIRTLAELVNHDRQQPGKLNYASSGTGSMQHIAAELLNQASGTKFTHVPYKGTGPALTDMLGGLVDFSITAPPPVLPFIEQGKLRALAVTGAHRLARLPHVPTAQEAGFPVLSAASTWGAVYAPTGTPTAVVDKLAEAIRQMLGTKEVQERFEDQGAQGWFMPPEALGKFTQEEWKRWGAVVKAGKIRAD